MIEYNLKQPNSKTTICLNMIVKNEANVIARCLESVKPLIDHWVIVDTGSTDGTQAIIQSTLKDIPGELHERPWRDFGYNRTEAIELARNKAHYLFVIDADDLLVIPPKFVMPKLNKDVYSLCVEHGEIRHWRMQLFRADLDFHYVGVIHEALVSREQRSHAQLPHLHYHCTSDGARSNDVNKYHKDAAILESALQSEPLNTRYAFYLAQSLRDANEFEKAMTAYRHRVSMGGWQEEVYFSLHEIARLSALLELEDQIVIERYLQAYEQFPARAEPLCNLAIYLRHKGRHSAAYPFARAASEIPKPDHILFVDDSVYAWRALDEYAVAASWVGRFKEAILTNQKLLHSKILPLAERNRIQGNLVFCREKLNLTR